MLRIKQAKIFNLKQTSQQGKYLLLTLNSLISNLKISDKLNLGFGILVTLTFLVIGRSYLNSVQATLTVHRTQDVRMPAALVSADAQTNLLKMVSDVRGYLASGESGFRDRYQQSRQSFEARLLELTSLLQQQQSSDDQQRLKKLQQAYEEWSALPDRLFILRNNLLDNQPALRLLDQEGEVPIATILAETERIVQQQKAQPTSNSNTVLEETLEFKGSFTLMVSQLRGYLVTRDPEFRFDYAAYLKTNQAAWQALQKQRETLLPVQQASLNAIAQAYQKFQTLPPRLFGIVEGDHYREDLFLFRQETEPLTEEMLTLLDEIVASQQNALTFELQETERGLATGEWQTLLGGLIALLLSVGLTVGLRRQIARPIKRLTTVTTRIMEGDLHARADVSSQDEIGILAQTFNQMTDYLQRSQHELEEYSRNLEHRVDIRTQELKEKNQQLGETLLHLQHTQAQLIQTEKMSSLGQLVAGVAHEINNPVNFIHGNIMHANQYAQDLLRLVQLYRTDYPCPNSSVQDAIEEIDLEFLEKDLPKLFSSMQIGAERIREIVQSLRVFSRLDEAEVKEVNIHEGIDSTLMILHNRLKAKSDCPEIDVVKEYGNLPLIECHAGQLNQVFMNILTNAIDALEDHERKRQVAKEDGCLIVDEPITPTIHIRTEVVDGDRVAIHIADNGPGMTQEVQQRLFDPFFTTKPIGKGTGLGMSISHQIITEKHKGSLRCVSAPQKGSEFVIEVPICEPSSSKKNTLAK